MGTDETDYISLKRSNMFKKNHSPMTVPFLKDREYQDAIKATKVMNVR
jgi:hypothetical protein